MVEWKLNGDEYTGMNGTLQGYFYKAHKKLIKCLINVKFLSNE